MDSVEPGKNLGDEIVKSLLKERTMTVSVPKEPNRITFDASEIFIGSDSLCMTGEWELDFEKIKTLEFKIGDKIHVFKKVQV